jgi:hypothetical protein
LIRRNNKQVAGKLPLFFKMAFGKCTSLNADIGFATKTVNNKCIQLISDKLFNTMHCVLLFAIELAHVIFHVCKFLGDDK